MSSRQRESSTTPTPDRHTAARILQRRYQAKINYRRRRDRKLADDWLGREFRFIPPMDISKPYRGTYLMRLEGYNPANATIKLRLLGGNNGLYSYTTDEFWAKLRKGEIVQV